jgi:hypothetical protein
VDEAEEVFYMVFPAGNDAAEAVHPGEQPFHLPSPAVAAQRASVLSAAFSSAPVGRDQLDAVLFFKLRVEPV